MILLPVSLSINKPPQNLRVGQDWYSHYFFPDYLSYDLGLQEDAI